MCCLYGFRGLGFRGLGCAVYFLPREPNTPLIKAYTLNFGGLNIMILRSIPQLRGIGLSGCVFLLRPCSVYSIRASRSSMGVRDLGLRVKGLGFRVGFRV